MKSIHEHSMRDICIGPNKFQKLKKHSNWIGKFKRQDRNLGLAQGREGTQVCRDRSVKASNSQQYAKKSKYEEHIFLIAQLHCYMNNFSDNSN